jgi:hypothetical protein
MSWQRNHGMRPRGLEGRRVKVRLHNGTVHGEPSGWPVGGENVRGACNWTVSDPPHPFEIDEYWVL